MRLRRVWLIGFGLLSASCAAMQPQTAARQQSEAYYNTPYEQLSPREKMGLENHLARQSNQAWRTVAANTSGMGRLVQGVGVLLHGVKR